MTPIIGMTIPAKGRSKKVAIDPAALLASHLAVIASSGGGKSWLLRRLLEQTFGLFPHIVIDVEGELKTLREKYDYVIASADDEGDCLAHPRTAKLLARRLLELNASCIIDIQELSPENKVEFVKEFVYALINAPKNLWGPRLIVIDEAQEFCPEKQGRGQASKGAIIDLLSRGRKRGLSTVLASQRLSKVSKDALGECRNKIYGFCNLPADRKRATEDLGFLTKADQELFRQLDTGEFYATGPAISKKDVIKIRVGDVQTTHPRVGEGIVVHTPPPKAKVKRLIVELGNLPKQAKKEAETLKEAKAEVKYLQREMRELKKGKKTVVATGASEKDVARTHKQGYQEGHAAAAEEMSKVILVSNEGFDSAVKGYDEFHKHVRGVMDTFRESLLNIRRAAKGKPAVKLASRVPKFAPSFSTTTGRTTAKKANISNAPRVAQSSNGDRASLKKPQLAVLDSLAWWEVVGQAAPDLRKVSFVAGYKVGGNFNNLISALKSEGYLTKERGELQLTEEGKRLADYPGDEPTTEELQKLIHRKLKVPQSKVLNVVIDAYPEEVSKDELAEGAGYHVGGNFNNIVSALKSLGLIVVSRGMVKADEMLFVE